MHREPIRDWLQAVEGSAPLEQWAVLCFVAGRQVRIDSDELNGAIRRSQLLLATGGDPRRGLDLHGRAVTALASDLDRPERRDQLRDGLAALAPEIAELRGVSGALRVLLGDSDLAWHAFAMTLLAEALDEADEEEEAPPSGAERLLSAKQESAEADPCRGDSPTATHP